MNEVKSALAKVWLDFYTKQVVSARACANQFSLSLLLLTYKFPN
jgi:hypothetical protein